MNVKQESQLSLNGPLDFHWNSFERRIAIAFQHPILASVLMRRKLRITPASIHSDLSPEIKAIPESILAMLSGNQSVINLAPYWTRVASRGITAISHATTKAMNATGPTSNNEAMSRI